MKVILTSKIRNLGEIGDIKMVADGYGKNYLLPKKLAIIYSEANYKVFEEKKKLIEIENIAKKQKAEEIKTKLEKKDIVLIEGAGDNDRLYGSVSATKLANFVNNMIKEPKAIGRGDIFIKEPIKTLGKFTVAFNLHSDVSLEKDVIVARSKEEAEKIKKGEFVKKDDKKVKKDEEGAEAEAKTVAAKEDNKSKKNDTIGTN